MANSSVGHVEFGMVNSDFHVKNGSCVTCDNKVQCTSVITCTSCCEKFHAVCPSANKQNKICNETLLKNFSQNSTKNNFKWYCNVCLTLYEHNKKCGLEEKLASVLLQFGMFTDIIKNIQNEVANNTKSVNTLLEKSAASTHVVDLVPSNGNAISANNGGQCNAWNMQRVATVDTEMQRSRDLQRDENKARKNKRKKEKSSLILKCNEEGESPNLSEIRDVAVTYGIPINQVNITANNNAVITLPTEDVLNKFKPLLTAKPSLKQHQVDKVKHKLPRVSILDIDEKFEESDFIDTVKLQNPDIAELIDNGEVFTDIYIKNGGAHSHKSSHMNVTVSENIRKLIRNRRNRIYLGLRSCRVVDRTQLNRCYKCHDHTHIAKYCENTPCCGYCSSKEHVSDDCAMKIDVENNKCNFKCINCMRNKYASSGHSVYWPSCPVNKHFHRKSLPVDNNTNETPALISRR